MYSTRKDYASTQRRVPALYSKNIDYDGKLRIFITMIYELTISAVHRQKRKTKEEDRQKEEKAREERIYRREDHA